MFLEHGEARGFQAAKVTSGILQKFSNIKRVEGIEPLVPKRHRQNKQAYIQMP